MTAARDAIVAELRQAAKLMSRRERALGDTLLVLVRKIYDAADFLESIANPASPEFEAAHALMAEEVRRQLLDACTVAVGVHAAAVGDALGSSVH